MAIGGKMKHAFLVQHAHQLPRGDEESVKIIGIYGSESSARLAVRRAKRREGFRDSPDGFSISRYPLGKDHWVEGFVTVIRMAQLRSASLLISGPHRARPRVSQL
jgi:hypothetical protein